MGLNVATMRMMMNFKKPLVAKTEKDDDSKNPKSEHDTVKEIITENAVNTFTFFSIYDGITNRLGNFYSETLAKMTGAPMLNKRVFNSLYNSTLNKIVNNALENANAGNKPDFNALAETVKNEIIAKLEACNYDPVQYQQNQLSENIKENYDKFNQ